MNVRRGSGTVFILGACVLAAGSAEPPGPTIDHQPVDCIVAGQYPQIPACLQPAEDVARGRLYFQAEGQPAWYYVEMKAEMPCWTGILPRPSRSLIDRHIHYYVEATLRNVATARTEEYAALVVRSKEDCKKPLVAALSQTGPAAVLPLLPAGFSVGAFPTALAIGGAVAVAGGVTAVVVPSDPSPSPAPQPTPTPGPNPTPTPGPSPTPTPTPTPTPSPTPSPTPASRYTLEVRKTPVGMILGAVTSTPAGINCGLLCTNASATFASGTVVTLTAQAILGSFQRWTGDCGGSGACVVTMDADKTVFAHFVPVASRDTAEPGLQVSRVLRSTMVLPRGRGEVTLNGRRVVVSAGEGAVSLPARAGENLVEGVLREGAGSGLWHFTLAPARAGASSTLTVLYGEPVTVTPDSVVFRVKGRPGERVSFVVRIVPRSQDTPPGR